MTIIGLLLAAGAGTRMGGPKALLVRADGSRFVDFALTSLVEGGADEVVVVVGAEAEAVREHLRHAGTSSPPGPRVRVVVADDWATGMAASLRAGLREAQRGPAACAVVLLVDLPDVTGAVVARVLAAAEALPTALVRATYHGAPGHPVVLGRDHWARVLATAQGDRGAREYLAGQAPVLVPCGDLATGRDTDTPTDLSPG